MAQDVNCESIGNSKANNIASIFVPVEAVLFVTLSLLGIQQDT